jgi:hypothetical protein
MKKLLLLTFISVLLLSSCEDFLAWLLDDSGTGSTKRFWAVDRTKNSSDPNYFYQLYAELLAENEYCKVYAERYKGVTKTVAQNMADEYLNIRTKMLNAFGLNFTVGGRNYDTLQLADYYGNEDGTLTILLLDIKDSFRPGVNNSYVAGYFHAYNFFEAASSNECDMIYVDINPGKPGSDESNRTLAHELQHLMNFATTLERRSVWKNGVLDDIFLMDTWIDEGLASAAEWVYSGEYSDDWEWYNKNGAGEGANRMTGSINKGNNFFVWGNRTDDNPYAILDDYATVNLFFQWLRIQNGGANNGMGIYKDIIGSANDDYLAVTAAASKFDSSYNNGNWEKLLGDWLAANYINSSSGPYGYGNDTVLRQIKGSHQSSNASTVNLYPGEGVYSRTNGPPSLTSYTNIKYSFLLSNNTVSNSYSSGSTLLTFNRNSDIEGTYATGDVTGNAADVSVADPVNGRSVASSPRGPYRIGIGDIGREAFENLPPGALQQLPNRFTLREE